MVTTVEGICLGQAAVQEHFPDVLSSSSSSTCSDDVKSNNSRWASWRPSFWWSSRKNGTSDKALVERILCSFRENNVVKLNQFLAERNEDNNQPEEVCHVEFEFCDEYIDDEAVPPNEIIKVASSLPRHISKSVKFSFEVTPEEKPKRMFVPMSTSTPRDISNIHDIQSNTFSPVLKINSSVMSTLNKSRARCESALSSEKMTDYLKLYHYDNGDEAEVEDKECNRVTSNETFTIKRQDESELGCQVLSEIDELKRRIEQLEKLQTNKQKLFLDSLNDSSKIFQNSTFAGFGLEDSSTEYYSIQNSNEAHK
ncbi:unnamed protein product [Caenorhabditis bovis]|uniref:Uncharacterized protein n=1 Tax=Caenorhabditis bovis TaxID=2654633 RepID=A0A8S1EL11_9PELO|nr:unnamed protein product [Caenorhabditis bovis]